MRRFLLLAGVAAVAGVSLALAAVDEPENRPPESPRAKAQDHKPTPQPIELSGRLQRPPKWYPQLELIPAGQIKRFDLKGDLLRDIEEGTPIRVRGVVRSYLHLGGTKDDPSPFPPQWQVWLEVTSVEVLDDPRDVLKSGGES